MMVNQASYRPAKQHMAYREKRRSNSSSSSSCPYTAKTTILVPVTTQLYMPTLDAHGKTIFVPATTTTDAASASRHHHHQREFKRRTPYTTDRLHNRDQSAESSYFPPPPPPSSNTATESRRLRTLFFSNAKERNTSELNLYSLSRSFIRDDEAPLFVDAAGNQFFSVQHYLEYRRALFFAGAVDDDDKELVESRVSVDGRRTNNQTAKAILNCKNSADTCTYELAEYDNSLWTSSQEALLAMDMANYLKFSQNADLQQILLGTADNRLSEASGSMSGFYGNGFHISYILAPVNNYVRNHPNTWRGKDLFGKSLMTVRAKLSGTSQNQGPVAVAHGGSRRRRPLLSTPTTSPVNDYDYDHDDEPEEEEVEEVL